MNRSVFGIFILLIVSPFNIVFGQASATEADTTFENYMSNAWQEIQKAKMSDSLQVKYAKEFYDYFLKNPESETGLNAIRSSFMMWGNTKTSDYVDDILQSLDYNSKVWGNIIFTFGNFYSNEEHKELIEYLSENLTEPRGKSEAIIFLLRSELREENHNEELAKDLARQLVEINATDFHVKQGLGYLHEFESLNIGQQAPDFNFQSIDGGEISLGSLKGRYTILEFWATWCGPCIPEIPHLKSLYEEYGDDGFTIIGISLDRDKDTLVDFIAENDMPWPQIYVSDGWEAELPRLFNVSGIPRMYLLDPDGVIIGRDLRGEEMVSKVESLMSD